MDELPPIPRKGRGAIANPGVRYEATHRVAIDDGWHAHPDDDPDLAPLRTTVEVDHSRSVIARNSSPDVPFDRSINPYRGCEHGCIYCFARPGHAWLGLSPGLDFETRLFAKAEAAERLRAELSKPGYRCAPIALGTHTDPYQPIERERRITRAVLEVLSAFHHPVAITTKSALVARDADILADMAGRNLVHVAISVTTLAPATARSLEPRAASPAKRLDAVKALSEAGVPVTVMAAPIIPGLTDHELEAILAASAEAGARRAGYILMRLPGEVEELFCGWLKHHHPDRAGKVLSLIRQCRSGSLSDNRFERRLVGLGPYAQLIHQRFHKACARLGLVEAGDLGGLDCKAFRPPPKPGDQLALF